MTVRPHGILLTQEIFARMAEYLPDSPPGLVDVFIEGLDLGQAQESLTTVLLPAMRASAQARAHSTRGRGLVVLDQRKGGAIWYLDHQAARAAFQQIPIEIWYSIDQLLRSYQPLKEVIVLRLTKRLLEGMYFQHDDLLSTLSRRPITIPALPHPLAREALPEFSLPADVSSRQEHGPKGISYIFTHRRLGELGRMLISDVASGQMLVTHLVAGTPGDPMLPERQALLLPIVHGLTRHLELQLGLPDPGATPGVALPPDMPPIVFPEEVSLPIATTIHDCARCGREMVLLIFADDPGQTLEDYARKMFEIIQQKNLTTFVLGPSQGGAEIDIDERPSALLEVWPVRKPVRQVTPPEFEALVAKLSAQHCKNTKKQRR